MNQLIWITSQLTGFYMMQVFTEMWFPVDFYQVLPQCYDIEQKLFYSGDILDNISKSKFDFFCFYFKK